MLPPPLHRTLEFARPQADTRSPRHCFLPLVIAIGHCQALADQLGPDVALTGKATRQLPFVAVLSFRSAVDALRQHSGKGSARPLATGIAPTVECAELMELRRVDTFEADDAAAEPKRVPVGRSAPSLKARRVRVSHDRSPNGEKPSDNHGQELMEEMHGLLGDRRMR